MKFESLLSGLPSAALLHREGTVLAANEAAGSLLAIDPAELREVAVDSIFETDESLSDSSSCGMPHSARLLAGAHSVPGKALSFGVEVDGEPAIVSLLWPTATTSEASETAVRLHDAATGLATRALFIDRVDHFLDRARQNERSRCALLRIELGGASDLGSLVSRSQAIAAQLRPTDTLARWGHHDLAVLLEDVADSGQAVRTSRRILETMEKLEQTVAIGIVLGGDGQRGPELLLEQADSALQRARDRGTGWAIWDETMHAEALSRTELEIALRRAVESWQLELHYQPILGLTSRDIVGFEALLRWNHPERDLVLPGEFLPLAEEIDLMGELGSRVLAEACDQIARWANRPGGGPFVTVNLSRPQLESPDLPDVLRQILKDRKIRPDRLCLEVAEAVVLEAPEASMEILQALRGQGVRLSLDDFGLAHASLGVLQRFPFDEVKIDRWLVRRLGRPDGAEDLIAGLLSLCRSRRIVPVAEGIENEEQEAILRKLGCARAQGFLYSRPVPADLATGLL